MRQKLANPGTRFLFIAFLLVSLSGCVIPIHFTKSDDVDDQEETDSILVVGYVDDNEAPFTMEWGEIKQVRPSIDEPYKELRSNEKGLFYLENLPVGSYQLIELGGPDKGFMSGDTWRWGFAGSANEKGFERIELKAKKPGIYYLGSYKIDLVKDGGLFGSDKYETMPIDQPNEKEVLKQLLPHTEGTKWERIVKQRISELK